MEVLHKARVLSFIGIIVIPMCLFDIATASTIAFVAHCGSRWQPYVLESQRNSLISIPSRPDEDANGPSVLAGGGFVAFEQSGVISSCDFKAPRSEISCHLIPTPGKGLSSPTWVAAGGELLAVRCEIQGSTEDCDIVKILDVKESLQVLVRQTGNQNNPDISRSGRYVAYDSAQTVGMFRSGVRVVRQIWIADLRSGHSRQLLMSDGQDLEPVWSPDDTRIAFTSDRSGQFEIWTVNSDDGRELRQVTSGAGIKSWPAWSPDGNELMYTQVENGHQSLWIITVDGRSMRRFEPFAGPHDCEMRDADWR